MQVKPAQQSPWVRDAPVHPSVSALPAGRGTGRCKSAGLEGQPARPCAAWPRAEAVSRVEGVPSWMIPPHSQVGGQEFATNLTSVDQGPHTRPALAALALKFQVRPHRLASVRELWTWKGRRGRGRGSGGEAKEGAVARPRPQQAGHQGESRALNQQERQHTSSPQTPSG